ncbi:diphosphomevalonate decarboxylase [Candidatus Woesebacteria bacterium]|nr:diphosphomevalonate decarboxylase [Candidatus Woesebacteria bacterium]
MQKSTAQAHSNIALVKYWGKGDEKLRLPVNSSAAIALDNLTTTTTVEFREDLASDQVELVGDGFEAGEVEKVSKHLDRVREIAKISLKAKVVSQNSFPKAAGMASSASGFAALSVAAASAAGLTLSEKDLSVLARQGSGSASRSVPGGVSVWHAGTSNETSYAEPISYPKEWDLHVLLVMAEDTSVKKVGSTEGMALATTSPYFKIAVEEAEKDIESLSEAMKNGDWRAFGKVIEDECFRLHMLCMTTSPNILYWRGVTVEVFQKLLKIREGGVEAFFTVDAGPHVHVVCKGSDVEQVEKSLSELSGIKTIIKCGIGDGTKITDNHLF